MELSMDSENFYASCDSKRRTAENYCLVDILPLCDTNEGSAMYWNVCPYEACNLPRQDGIMR